jgi:hypothetical protein
MLDALGRITPANEALDALIPAYIEAELAGENAAARFPDAHAYILSNDEAGALYADLLDAALADRTAAQPAPAANFKPDLSFLSAAPDERNASVAWQQRIVAFAKHAAQTLLPGRALRFEDFADFFFDIRREVPDGVAFERGVSSAFAAVEGEVPEEIRWLEAAYQFDRLRGTTSDPALLSTIARAAAENAGLPRQVRARFVELVLAWPAA